MKLRTSLCLAAGVAAMSASCITPGQYRIYRIASSSAEQSPGCYPSAPGVDITGDSTTFRTGQTFAVFAADSDIFFLDLEEFSLQGDKSGSDYKFTAESTDVMNLGGDSILTVTTAAVINVEIKGKKVRGTSTFDVRQSCSGGMNCPNPSSTQCITTQSFLGSEVKDAELEHPI